MTGVVTNFASLAGNQPASLLDNAFLLCAKDSDLVALTAIVTGLPGTSLPLVPVAGGVVGVDTQFSREDHQHPPQPATINLQSGTTYTVAASDDGKVVELSNAGAIALTIPNSLPVGFSCLFTQAGVGQVTSSAGPGATQNQASGFSKSRSQWSVWSLYVRANVGGSAAQYVISGDLTA